MGVCHCSSWLELIFGGLRVPSDFLSDLRNQDLNQCNAKDTCFPNAYTHEGQSTWCPSTGRPGTPRWRRRPRPEIWARYRQSQNTSAQWRTRLGRRKPRQLQQREEGTYERLRRGKTRFEVDLPMYLHSFMASASHTVPPRHASPSLQSSSTRTNVQVLNYDLI